MNSIFFPKQTIGLLGGSFNPAHVGHLHISMEAIKRLGINKIVWLVSPQNPLKSVHGMAAFDERFKCAKLLSGTNKSIKLSDIESKLGTRYTVDTLRALKKRFPHCKFVWIMGADNLATVHKWEKWQEIFKLCPVLVLDRAPFSESSLRGKAALRFAKSRVYERNIRLMKNSQTPCFGFGHIRLHKESSTRIRARLTNAEISNIH